MAEEKYIQFVANYDDWTAIKKLKDVGAIFLGLIAVLPLAMRAITGLVSLTIGGTALLIVVSVVLETIKQIQAQIVMREYE